ncbi:MAG: hypothetical protein B9S34_10610 [Opitutia bacterium Tous-C1TDCM]|nr:MAG: hypothetical protein B9S34_10610 [Opitutae bacterium Tous-C1TDCM]
MPLNPDSVSGSPPDAAAISPSVPPRPASASDPEFERICRLAAHALAADAAVIALAAAPGAEPAFVTAPPPGAEPFVPFLRAACADAARARSPVARAAAGRRLLAAPIGGSAGALGLVAADDRAWIGSEIALAGEFAALAEVRLAQRAALDKLRGDESKLRKIASRVPGVIYQYRLRPDGTSCFPYASERLREIYGVAPEAVVADAAPVFGQLHPADLAGIVASIQESARTLQPWQYEYRTQFADGTERWLRGDSIPEREADGAILWHGFITDVTARKQAETALRESEERFRLNFTHAGIGMAIVGLDGRWLDANPALLAMLGWSLPELAARTIQDLTWPGDPDFDANAGKLLRQEIPVARVEKRYRCADGSGRWCKLTAVVVRDGQGRPLHFIAQLEDIQAAREATEAKERIERKLAETAKLESLGVLAGGIAHDFNNLLTGVLGNASLLRLELAAQSPHLAAIGQIETAAHRAADLCKQMLAYSGKGRFVVKNVDLNRLITETARLLEISISKHTVLRFHLAPQLPAIEADETQLRQIVMNLVINASEAIGERSGVVALATGTTYLDSRYAATLRFEQTLPPGPYTWIEVSDNGCGMAPEVVERIFDPFFSTKFAGRGLGLAAVQGIVRSHRGGIKIYSEPGKGTTFRLLFPSVPGPAQPVAPAAAPAAWQGHGKVLVVDDEETVRSVAARLLAYAGFTAETANDGVAALELFRRGPAAYAFVLLDLTMPHLDGEETFRQLRHIYPGVRVVLMSGFNHQEVITRFAGKGLAGFVPKPLDGRVLLEAARAAVGP